MGYVGNKADSNYSSIDKQIITGNGGTSYTLSHSVANANEIEVFVNNVRQDPGVAYTVNNAALTMTGAVANSDSFYVVFIGKAVQTKVPADGSVGTAKLASGIAISASTGTFSGNVGIGTTTPDHTLVVRRTDGTSKILELSTGDSTATMNFSRDGNPTAFIKMLEDGSSGTGALIFGTGSSASPAERMRLTSAGNVGIGTTNPSCILHASAGSNSSGLIDVARFKNKGTSPNDGARIQLTAGGSTSGAGIGCLGDALNSAHLVFHAGGNTERMRLTSAGNFHVGCTATPSSSVSGFMFSSDQFYTSAGNTTNTNTQIRFINGNGLVGSVTVSGSSTSFNTSSDYRIKENVDYTWDATARLKQLKPARFNFIADDTNTLVDGFLAHEVSSIVPEAITGTKDKVDDNGDAVMQSIDQSKLVPLLVKTIQELEARITALEAE